MRQKVTNLVIGIGLLIPLLLAGCDSWVDVKGTIYEWRNAPKDATGQVYINQEPPREYDLEPVAGATVRFFNNQGGFGGPDEKRPFEPLYDPHNAEHQAILSSSSSGAFGGFWVVGLGEYYMKIMIEKYGFKTLEYIFPFDGGKPDKNQFKVLLVRIS